MTIDDHGQAAAVMEGTPTAGHQGFERTLDRLWRQAYWASMAKDVERYWRECTNCQKSKLSMPQHAPLTADDCS